MSIYIGNKEIKHIFKESTLIKKVYRGGKDMGGYEFKFGWNYKS